MTEQCREPGQGVAPGGAAACPRTVLVAADDAQVRAAASSILSGAGFTVRESTGTRDVLEAARRWRPAALVLDLTGLDDGLRLLDALRTSSASATVPVVALTDATAPAGAWAALTHGADDFVARPVGLPELAVRVAALVRRRHGAARDAGPRLRIHLFGPLRLEVDGRAVIDEQFTRRKVKALFAYLYLHRGRYVGKHRLLHELWPGADDATPGRLKQTVSVLRATIDAPGREGGGWRYIGERGGRYYFNQEAAYWSDLEAFEREIGLAREHRHAGEVDRALTHYRRALDLRQGDFLPDFAAEDWAVPEATRLQELHFEALEEAASLYRSRGEHGLAVGLLRRVVLEDRLREASYVDLMRTLWLEGKHTEALRTYRRLTEVLARTFQVPPQPQATALYEAIRRDRASPGQESPSPAPLGEPSGDRR